LKGFELNAFRPTSLRLGPRLPSTTMVKLKPKGRSKIGSPSGVVPLGSISSSSGRARPT
jgi:hypothetical protein